VKVLVLASEGLQDRDLWYPTILGVLVVISAVSLFCGSIYLLLATNLGARLGFLIAAAGLSGFMVLMAFLWLTTSSPLNTLKGRVPNWTAVEVIEGGDLARSDNPAVQNIREEGRIEDPAEQANLKAAADSVVVTQDAGAGSEIVAESSRFAIYGPDTPYIVTDFFETGGGNIFSQVEVEVNSEFPLVHVSLHKPHYAVVDICPADQEKAIVPFGDAPPTPVCDESEPIQSVVFVRDLGSVRVPPFVAMVGSLVLFILCLLGLHWRERDLQEQAAAVQAEAEKATAGALERTPEKV
jgi:hypothetical protein